MHQSRMTSNLSLPYELSNNQRQYFGLLPVVESWDKQSLGDEVTVYFEVNKIVKVLNFHYGYLEYDCEIETKDRQILLPRTLRGKERKLTITRILKIKGSGIQFSGSFQGGGIHVYDQRRNVSFIKSYYEEGQINNYQDIQEWVSKYISSQSHDYFKWLEGQISQKRIRVWANEGDVFAFKISQTEYGFARILLDISKERKRPGQKRPELSLIHPRSFLVAPYAFYANTLDIGLDTLICRKTMPAICMFDVDFFRGEMPIIGFRPLSESDRNIPFPEKLVTSITIPYTKSDLDAFIATGSVG